LSLLSPGLLQAVYEHARATYPEECCGFLIGPAGGALDEVRRVENQQNELHRRDPERYPRDARTAYNMGPRDIRLLEQSLSGERPVGVIYHSHSDVGAYFSAEDKAAATWEGEPLYPSIAYLVVDVRKDGVQGARLFRFDAARRDFVEVAELGR
jgi:adenylyltransferase/sulfurtransferase